MRLYTPEEYIILDVADKMGIKGNFEARLDWYDAQDSIDLNQAKKPALAFAGMQALDDFYNDRPSGFLVGLDACASGIGIMGLLTRCATTLENVGIAGSDYSDIYTKCTEEMNITGYDRDPVKKAQMTYMYGSEKQPRKVFFEEDALDKFYAAQEVVCPGAVYVRELLLNLWDSTALAQDFVMPDGHQVHVPVLDYRTEQLDVDSLGPITFRYQVNEPVEYKPSISANVIHAIDGWIVRELQARCNYDPAQVKLWVDTLKQDDTEYTAQSIVDRLWQKTGVMSVAALDQHNGVFGLYTNKEALVATLEHMLTYPPFPVIQNHDEHKCHPNHMNRLRFYYVRVLADLARGHLLKSIIEDISCEEFTSDFDGKKVLIYDILQGNYSLA